MVNKYTFNQFLREAEEYRNPYIFMGMDPKRYNHIWGRHMKKRDKQLKARLEPIEYAEEDDIIAMSCFNQDITKEQLCSMIADTLVHEAKSICKHLKNMGAASECFHKDFPYPIGMGIVKGLEDKVLPMSRMRVVVGHSNKEGRLFRVITAYPVFDWDETDVAYEALYGLD